MIGDDEAPEGSEDEQGDDEADDEDETPRVIVTRVSSLAKWFSPEIAKSMGDRPVWFMLQSDEEFMTLFDRVPEDPMSKGKVEAILAGLRSFATARNEVLQLVLGVTDGISFGFHTDAPHKRVLAAFDDDGFELVGEIVDGELVATEEESDEASDGDDDAPDDDDAPEGDDSAAGGDDEASK